MVAPYLQADGEEPWMAPSATRMLWSRVRGEADSCEADFPPHEHWRDIVEASRERTSDPYLDQTDPAIVMLALEAAIAHRLVTGVLSGERAHHFGGPESFHGKLLPVLELRLVEAQTTETFAKLTERSITPRWGAAVVHLAAIRQCAPPLPAADVSPVGHVVAVAA